MVKKITLRRSFTEGLERANIYLAGCGRGRMLGGVWLPKMDHVLAVDCDPAKIAYVRYHFPGVDARLGDFNDFADWPRGIRFRIADFDPYGSPYDAIENFFRQRRWQTHFLVFVTDGVPLWLGRGGMLPRQFRSENIPRRACDPQLRQVYFESLVWPWWADLANMHGLRITRTGLLWKKGKTIAYYAVRLELRVSTTARRCNSPE